MYRTVAAALTKRAAPAISIGQFFAGITAHHRALLEKKRQLKQERDQIVLRMVRKRDQHGRFLRLVDLRAKLNDINTALRAA